MRPSASRSTPTIGCSSRRTPWPAPCTAARTVSTRKGPSGRLTSSADPAGGDSTMRTAIGSARARQRSRRGRTSGGRAPRGRTCAAARAGCGPAARGRSRSGARCEAGSPGSRSALRAHPGADARRGGRSRRARYPVEPRAWRAGGTIAVRASAASSLAPIASRTAISAMRSVCQRTLVSGGSSRRETGWSSKPTTATSSGMRRPSSRQAA